MQALVEIPGRMTGNINTFNKSYGGAGFKVSPEILVFSRKVISEYKISD
jgi:hypothetical protein